MLLRGRAGLRARAPRPRSSASPPAELARLHAGADYYVYFVGLHPRPALHDRDARAAHDPAPRRTRGRRRRRGASASAASSAASTPVESPGGFWVLGRTPVRLYDPAAADPILLRAGDHVRFRAIDRAEYDAIAARGGAGRYAPRISRRRVMSELLVQEPGPLTTIQDLGRFGHLRVGIPTSGPMDRDAFRARQPARRQPGRRRRARVHAYRRPRRADRRPRWSRWPAPTCRPTVNGAPVPALGRRWR